MSQKFILNPSAATDLILKPAVGVTCVTSSEANCLSNVVFPELSRPNNRIRTSFSGAARNFLSNDKRPYGSDGKVHKFLIEFKIIIKYSNVYFIID